MRVLVAGAGGFVGGHLVKRLLAEGHVVRAVDIEPRNKWWQRHAAAENIGRCDLRSTEHARQAVWDVDHVYNLACDMGGMGFIESHKADCMQSVLINMNLLRLGLLYGVQRHFFSSSACVYPYALTNDGGSDYRLQERDAYPADPLDGYGWEKLFSERACRHFYEDYGMETRVARFDPIYGPYGTWDGGREKAPAAMCRKVALAKQAGEREIEMWGDGEQTRTFCFIDDAIDGIQRIMHSDVHGPVNLGSSEVVNIKYLLNCTAAAAGHPIIRKHVDGPVGALGRHVDNSLLRSLGWEPKICLAQGIEWTYNWVAAQIAAGHSGAVKP